MNRNPADISRLLQPRKGFASEEAERHRRSLGSCFITIYLQAFFSNRRHPIQTNQAYFMFHTFGSRCDYVSIHSSHGDFIPHHFIYPAYITFSETNQYLLGEICSPFCIVIRVRISCYQYGTANGKTTLWYLIPSVSNDTCSFAVSCKCAPHKNSVEINIQPGIQDVGI